MVADGPTWSGGPLTGGGERLGRLLARLGSLCWRHAWLVVLLWVGAPIAGGSVASSLSERLLSGSGDVEGSMSLRVDRALRADFSNSDAQSLILTFQSVTLDAEPAQVLALQSALADRLSQHPAVATARSESQAAGLLPPPKPGGGHLVLIELATTDVLATEQEVSRIRAIVRPLLERAKERHPDLQWAVTGRAALTYDVNRFSSEDTARSELRALPVTLVILLLAFGSVVSAMIPLVLALVTRTVALGIVYLIAGSLETSNLVLSIVTMLAVALGIDYSLFLIHRYRAELARSEREHDAGSLVGPEEGAMRAAMEHAGTAVCYSAATVAIGMGALLSTPLMQTRSIGLGGVVAVLIALLASLTLVPALLRLLGARLLEWPRFMSRRISGERSRRLWSRWADMVLAKPVVAILASLALLLGLAAPGLATRFGFPESEFLPAELEYSRGMEMLSDMELRGLISPILVLVSDEQRNRLLPERTESLHNFATQLAQDRRVRYLVGPVEPGQAEAAATIEEGVERALRRRAFVSQDGSRALFRLVPSNDATLAELRDLAADIATLQPDGLDVEVGGQGQYYNDFERAVGEAYPLTIGLVLGLSAAALLLFFRAPLVSAKAILLNLLSVAAGYGVVVFVFQLGHGAELFGMAGPTQMVPITVPLVIFCILFGLSMDYEIFLLSRVRAIFQETGDSARSISEGVADTASVITSAALVMVAVFGAFAFARIFIVQMIGLGLAVAVLVDAAVIRSILGPALMQVAGKWNWWPGIRRTA